MEYDYTGARNAGIQDSEIADLLAKETGYNLEGARTAGVDDGEIARLLSGVDEGEWQKQQGLNRERQFNLETKGDVVRGLESGLDATQGSFYGMTGLAGSLLKKVGAEGAGQSLQDWGMEGYRRNMDEAFVNPTTKLGDIDGPGSAVDWAQGTFGSLFPSMVTAAVGTLTGTGLAGLGAKTVFKKAIKEMAEEGIKKQIASGAIKAELKDIATAKLSNAITKKAMNVAGKTGMGAAVLPMEAGSNYADLLETHGIDAPLSSLGFGALATALEYTGGNAKLIDEFLGAVTRGEGRTIKKVALDILKGSSEEALQEAGQETFSILNTVVNTDEQFLTKKSMGQLFEAAAAGAMGGAGGGVVSQANKLFSPEDVASTNSDISDAADEQNKAEIEEITNAGDSPSATASVPPPPKQTVATPPGAEQVLASSPGLAPPPPVSEPAVVDQAIVEPAPIPEKGEMVPGAPVVDETEAMADLYAQEEAYQQEQQAEVDRLRAEDPELAALQGQFAEQVQAPQDEVVLPDPDSIRADLEEIRTKAEQTKGEPLPFDDLPDIGQPAGTKPGPSRDQAGTKPTEAEKAESQAGIDDLETRVDSLSEAIKADMEAVKAEPEPKQLSQGDTVQWQNKKKKEFTGKLLQRIGKSWIIEKPDGKKARMGEKGLTRVESAPEKEPVTTTSIGKTSGTQDIQLASHKIAGAWATRVKLSDLRKAFPDLSREEFDTKIKEMQEQGAADMLRIEEPGGVTPEIEDGGIQYGGETQHAVYIPEPVKQQSNKKPEPKQAVKAPNAPEVSSESNKDLSPEAKKLIEHYAQYGDGQTLPMLQTDNDGYKTNTRFDKKQKQKPPYEEAIKYVETHGLPDGVKEADLSKKVKFDDVATNAGTPFKYESGAKLAIKKYGYEKTHEAVQVDGGWVGRVKPVEQKSKPSDLPGKPPEQLAAKIEDFGEKIGGARKDYATSLEDAKNFDTPKHPLSKTFPEPKYEDLQKKGVNPDTIAAVRAMRDEIPNKPRQAWKLKQWTQQVELLRNVSEKLLNGEFSQEKFKTKLAEAANLEGVMGRAKLYSIVGHGKSLKGVTLAKHHYAVYKGEKDVTKWTVEKKAKATGWSNWPRVLAEGKTEQEAIDNFVKNYENFKGEGKGGKKVKFELYTYRKDPSKKWIGKKVGRNTLDLKSFGTIEEAKNYLENNYDDLLELLKKAKYTPDVRRKSNEERIGTDYRGGKDVTPEMFSDAFGFRGVEFGNWVSKTKERQVSLNNAFDALSDLADILGVPTKAISLNGELGLAFGARGSGGKNAAAAHYEPGKVVINLTKKEGAGSLAHEWWHALDNYFSRSRNYPGDFLSERPIQLGKDNQIRQEMVDAFKGIVNAYKATEIEKRSAKLDRKRSKPYWNTGAELSARVFESYTIDKLAEQGHSNDYLANIVDELGFTTDMAENMFDEDFSAKDFYPYLSDSEKAKVNDAFDRFFKAIKVKKTDKGEALYSTRPIPPGQTVTLQDIQKQFKNQAVTLNDDGSVLVRLKNGAGLKIKSVRQVSEGKYLYSVDAGKMDQNGVIAGKYQSNEIELVEGVAGGKTLPHEVEHWLEDIGLITKTDQAAMDARIRLLNSKDKLGFNLVKDQRENRANFLAEYLANREQFRGTTVGRALQKIADLLDAVLHLGRSSVRGIAREIESGWIYERSAGDVKSGKALLSTSEKSDTNQPVTTSKGKADIPTALNPGADGGKIHEDYQDNDLSYQWKESLTRIREYIEINDNYGYGIRAIDPAIDSRLDIKIPKAGEVLPNSFEWEDGNTTEAELDGTAAFVPYDQADITEELPSLLKEALDYWTPDSKIRYVLVRGEYNGDGGMQEDHAGLIENAVAVAILDKDGNIIDSIFPNPSRAPKKGAQFSTVAEKGYPQDPDTTPYDEELKLSLTTAKDFLTGVFKNRKDKGKNYKEDLSAAALAFGSPLHNADKIQGAYGRLYNFIRRGPDIKTMKQNDLWKEDDHSMLSDISELQKKSKIEYARVSKHLRHRDINRIGPKVMNEGDGWVAWTEKNKDGKRTGIGKFEKEHEARIAAINHEVDNSGFSDAGKAALRSFRKIALNNYYHFAEGMEDVIKKYDTAGMPLPQIAMPTENGYVKVALDVAQKMLGDHTGYYFPRLRQSGEWQLFAEKKGKSNISRYFDSKSKMDGFKSLYEKKGYDVTPEKVGLLSEDIFQSLSPLLAQEAIFNRALEGIKSEHKYRTLEDLGLKMAVRDDKVVVEGSRLQDWMDTPMEALGGKYDPKLDQKGFMPRYTFESKPENLKEFEGRVTKALMESSGMQHNIELEFAKAFVKEYDAVLKSHGSRARMIGRSEAKGLKVAQGYETDPHIAIAQLSQATAGGHAKKQIAENGIKIISGQDIPWQEFKAKDGDVADLEKQLASEDLATPKQGREKSKIRREMTKLRKEIGNPLPPKELEKKHKRLVELNQELKELTRWRDKTKARKIKQDLAQKKVGLWQEWQAMVQERRIDPARQRKIYADSTTLLQDVLKNEEAADRVIGALKGVAVWQYLGFRVSSPVVNLTNMVMAVPAVMSSRGSVPLHKALSHVGKAGKQLLAHRRGKATGEVKKVFDEISKKGWDEPKFNREAFDALQSEMGKGWSWLLEKSMWMFGATEKINRATTISAAYFSMKENHKGKWDHDKMMEKAKDISDHAHGEYGKANRPYHMRGKNVGARILQMSYVFQTFSHNYIQEMASMGLKRKDYGAALWMALSPAVIGGIGATVPMGIAKALSNAFGGDDPEEMVISAAKQLLGEDSETFMRYGAAGLAGVSLKGSLAQRFGVPEKFVDIFGAPGAVVGDVYEGVNNITKGFYREGFEKMAPAFAQNISRGLRENSEGVTTRSGSPVFWGNDPLKADTIDMIMRFMSFNPVGIAGKREVQWKEYLSQNRFKEKKSAINKRFKKFYSKPSSERSKKDYIGLMADVRDFNETIKRKGLGRIVSPITNKSIKAALRSLKPRKSERER